MRVTKKESEKKYDNRRRNENETYPETDRWARILEVCPRQPERKHPEIRKRKRNPKRHAAKTSVGCGSMYKNIPLWRQDFSFVSPVAFSFF
jgi:hypothetical protein